MKAIRDYVNSRDRLAFLDEKRRLLTPFIRGDTAMNYEMMFSHIAGRIDSASEEIPDSALVQIDRSLENTISAEVLKADEQRVRATLKATYGLSSLSEEPARVLRRVVRQREIRDTTESEIVDRYLSGDFGGNFASAAKLRKLENIALAYRKSQSKHDGS